MHTQILLLIGVAGLMFLIIGGLAFISHYYTLNGIKSKTVGDGQHGTARWATKQEIRQTYAHIPYEPELWRQGKNLPDQQGLILGCEGPKGHVTAVVDTDDIHALVTAASGAGKTAFFLYPNIEYALATGMSFLCTDTKGDLFRNYAGIARECYGYQTAILDLRNPTTSGTCMETICSTSSTNTWTFTKQSRITSLQRPRRRNTPRSLPRPSSTPAAATAPSMGKTLFSTTVPRDF
jgi:type IV secretion system protein VirD4